MEWLTRPDLEEEVPKNDWFISVFPGGETDYGKPDPGIKSWAQPVGALENLLRKRYSLNGSSMFFTYCLPDGLKELSGGGTRKGWKDY